MQLIIIIIIIIIILGHKSRREKKRGVRATDCEQYHCSCLYYIGYSESKKRNKDFNHNQRVRRMGVNLG